METPIIFIEDKKNKIYMKRDDLLPFSFGGNKARKAVNFFREIDNGDYDCVVTYGSSSSNHGRIISNMAAARNMPCYIISPQESSEPTFNAKMMNLFGTQIEVVPVDEVHNTIEARLHSLSMVGRKPYFIPGGGHGNLGTQAYVDCYEEIANYEQMVGIHFDYIFFASGTGTTQAGLVCGQLIHHDKRNIVGISIARRKPIGRQVVIESVQDYLSQFEAEFDESIIDGSVIFIDDYTNGGYGVCDNSIEQLILEMLFKHGIPLDSTYTGKAYFGMQDYLEKEQIIDKNILFIHTGGTPLFFDDLEKNL